MRINVQFQRIDLGPVAQGVIPVIGATTSDGKTMVGLFREEGDLLSENPDKVAAGTGCLEELTPEQRKVAVENTRLLEHVIELL